MKAPRRVAAALVLSIILALLAGGVALAEGPMKAPVVQDTRTRPIEDKLLCQCGCTMGVAVCDCGTAEQMRKDIRAMMDKGMSEKEILASFVAQYGEKVLNAPTKSGFNWTAWITPFVAVAAGAVILYVLLSRWVKSWKEDERRSEDQEEINQEDQEIYGPKLQDVLKKHF